MSAYITGDIKRQAYFECALNWVSDGEIDSYMSKHRNDKNITELKKYFERLKCIPVPEFTTWEKFRFFRGLGAI